MTASVTGNDDELLHAYCDGELDPAAALAFEQRMAADEGLRVRYDRIMALREALRALPQEDVPRHLEARIEEALAEALPPRPTRMWTAGRSWQALAASALFGAVFASAVMLGIDRNGPDSGRQVAQQVVSNHIRSLLAPQPFDIASSDRHTVKPWFTTRIPESPQVVDLATQGFPLVGGRVDVIGRAPVATIVYRHAAHVISVSTLPLGQPVPDEAIAGYNVRSWRGSDFTYVAVSDIPGNDLAAFERAFRAGMPH